MGSSEGMGLQHAEMLDRFYERDAASNGLFVVGVLTTGIYCLPACTARKPKPENVRFFDDREAALAAGLRACKRCRPDDFYASFDPDRDALEGLMARVRTRPGEFASVGDMARAAGVGATKLNSLARRYYHATPANLLAEARVGQAARALLGGERRVLDIALDAGFESSSSFHDNFSRRFGLSPGAYRKLRDTSEFTIKLPSSYRCDELLAVSARSGPGGAELVRGNTVAKGVVLAGRAVCLELRIGAKNVRCRVTAKRKVGARVMAEAHRAALRMLGLSLDPEPFERSLRRIAGGRRLLGARSGLRIPLTYDVFEGLVWVIVGQQVNLTFAGACRDVLVELCGTRLSPELRTHPTPEQVAQLDPSALTTRKFSGRKAEYVIDTARAIASGDLDLEGMRTETVPLIEERLGAVRGLGPWSVNYLLMRSYGFADCVPVGDAGLVHSLATFFGLNARPDPRETVVLMERFAPYRSLATYHFWRRLGESE